MERVIERAVPVGAIGIRSTGGGRSRDSHGSLNAAERWPYFVFFVALRSRCSDCTTTGTEQRDAGVDRLPMTLGFMSLLAAMIGGTDQRSHGD